VKRRRGGEVKRRDGWSRAMFEWENMEEGEEEEWLEWENRWGEEWLKRRNMWALGEPQLI